MREHLCGKARRERSCSSRERREVDLTLNRILQYLAAAVFYAVFAAGVAGQNQGWQVVRADYGWQNQRIDVTERVRQLLYRSGNQSVRVNNQTMGSDPAVGKDKNLRIFARNYTGQTQTFTYNEGNSIDPRMFTGSNNGGFPNYPPPAGGYPAGPPGQAGYNDLQIVRAWYGVNNPNTDVTRILRGMVRNGSLVVQVNNNSMGGDPAVGADKVLTVVYRFRGGREQSTTVREGNTLRIP